MVENTTWCIYESDNNKLVSDWIPCNKSNFKVNKNTIHLRCDLNNNIRQSYLIMSVTMRKSQNSKNQRLEVYNSYLSLYVKTSRSTYLRTLFRCKLSTTSNVLKNVQEECVHIVQEWLNLQLSSLNIVIDKINT